MHFPPALQFYIRQLAAATGQKKKLDNLMGRVTIASHLVTARSRSRSCTPDPIADGGFRVSGADFIMSAWFSQWNSCCSGIPLTTQTI